MQKVHAPCFKTSNVVVDGVMLVHVRGKYRYVAFNITTIWLHVPVDGIDVPIYAE